MSKKRNNNNSNNVANNVVTNQEAKKESFVFELSLQYTKLTPIPKSGGDRKKSDCYHARLTDGFTAKDATKKVTQMLFNAAKNGVITSVCKTEYTVYYAIVKKSISEQGESIVSERRKLLSFEKSLNKGEASIGRWLHDLKKHLEVSFDDAVLPEEAQTYFDAMAAAKKKAQETAKKIQAAKKANKAKKETEKIDVVSVTNKDKKEANKAA